MFKGHENMLKKLNGSESIICFQNGVW
jgi:hypothetical protein